MLYDTQYHCNIGHLIRLLNCLCHDTIKLEAFFLWRGTDTMKSWVRRALDEGIVSGGKSGNLQKSQRSSVEEQQTSPWSRGMCLALSKSSCSYCHGLGFALTYSRYYSPCKCVMRRVFRLCLFKYREVSNSYDSMHQVRYDLVPAKNTGNRAMYSRPKQEFVADFEIIAKRIFAASSKEYQVFQLYFLAGQDWKVCTRVVGINRGKFFHMVYKVEECLGRAYFEVRPYPLYPTADYFESDI